MYYIAILPNDLIAKEITDFKLYAQANFETKHALTSPPHITIQSPFRWNKHNLHPIRVTLEKVCKSHTPFEISLKNFDKFAPRVIFVDVELSDDLIWLHQNLQSQMKEEHRLEDRFDGFHPHMTVAFKDLKKKSHVALIISTHGEGEAPDDAEIFYEQLFSKRAPELKHLHYSVLALGDSSYELFCHTGKEIDDRLTALGAQRISDRIDCDVDYSEDAANWQSDLLPLVKDQLSSNITAEQLQAIVRSAVAQQVRPLQKELKAYKEKVMLRDIAGGLGFIFGLFGVAAWMASRRNNDHQDKRTEGEKNATVS